MSLFYAAAIVAGGKSVRMGFDKARLTNTDGNTLISYAARELRRHFRHVFIVRKNGLFQDTELPADLPVVYDFFDNAGPNSGIHAALKNAGEGKYVYIRTCDSPYIDDEFITLGKKLIMNCPPDILLADFAARTRPFPGFYAASLADGIENYIVNGEQSPLCFAEHQNCRIVTSAELREADVDTRIFRSFDTTGELDGIEGCPY